MKVMISQKFHYYPQTRGSLQSGAYSFRPDAARPIPVAEKVTYSAVRGSLVKEIHQRFSSWLHQTLRLYRGEEYLELDWVIGPVPIGDDLGKEIVSIFSSNVSARGEFYTDSNARQMMKRTCWNETAGPGVKKPVASCYYPVTSRLCLLSTNTTTGMCILPDRSQGGTSFQDGEVELMVHRRLLTDDGFGLDETLNEEELGGGLVIRGKHRLLLGNHKRDVDELTYFERMSHAAHRWHMEPWQFAAAGDKLNRRKWQSLRNKRFSTLRVHGLPRHIRVLTLEPWKAGSVLLRLENTLEKSDRTSERLDVPEEAALPSHITVELRKVFQHLRIKSVRETTLGANQWLEEARQMDWSTRYVYTGGDDGLLPEDIDYIEEEKIKNKDSEPYPEEESDYVLSRKDRKRTNPTKRKTRIRRYDDDRRKRSVNVSENFIDSDNAYQVEFAKVQIKIKAATEQSEEQNEQTTQSNTHIAENVFEDVPGLTTVIPELNTEQKEYTSNLRTSESLEEESRVRWRKNGRKKRPAERFYINPEETNGDVTKSIYEMYYKKRAMAKSLRTPLIRNFAKVPEPPRRQQSQRKETEQSRRSTGTSMRSATMKMTETSQFRPRGTRVYDSGEETDRPFENEEDEDIEDINMELARMRARRSREGVDSDRWKRSVDSDGKTQGVDSGKRLRGVDTDRRKPGGVSDRRKRATGAPAPGEEAAPEYIVTLRPTQIRTFVVRFETSRNNQFL